MQHFPLSPGSGFLLVAGVLLAYRRSGTQLQFFSMTGDSVLTIEGDDATAATTTIALQTNG